MRMSLFRIVCAILVFSSCINIESSLKADSKNDPNPAAKKYDPMEFNQENQIKTLDIRFQDKTRNRDIPIRIYLPETKNAVPVLIFSHGLGGSCLNNAYLGSHWSKRGFIVVYLQHKGSDDSVWKNKSTVDAVRDMKKAANAENLFLRMKDVSVVIDQLEKWNMVKEHELYNRLNLEKIGMSGHSFGAVTTQAVSGQNFRISAIEADQRIKASVLLSPNIPKMVSETTAFESVKIPWLIMTGTHDNSIINDSDAASRLKVFPALPKGDKYELVLNKAEHSAFNDKGLPNDKLPRNPNHHKSILAISTAFWDAFLLENQEAKDWLNSDAVKLLLEKEDRWQKK